MLVLTRKPGQSIMIGEGIEVQVLSVAGEKVRLGITAPRDVAIFRNEVYERIEDEGDQSQPAARPSSTLETRGARARGGRRSATQSRRSRAGQPLGHQPGERLEHHDDHGHDRDRQATSRTLNRTLPRDSVR